MNKGEAMKLKPFVNRKLLSEGITFGDIENAKAVLSRCVMGAKLVKAYELIYEDIK